MAREIFISYSRNNLDLVKTIKSEIERETGTECWMDLNVIESGTDYLTSIEQGILNCKVFLFMLSTASQESKYAIGELNAALKQVKETGIHVALVNIDSCELNTKFTISFSTLDITLWQNKHQKEKFFTDLKKWLKITESAPLPPKEKKTESAPKAADNKSEKQETNSGSRAKSSAPASKKSMPIEDDKPHAERFSLKIIHRKKFFDLWGPTLYGLADAQEGYVVQPCQYHFIKELRIWIGTGYYSFWLVQTPDGSYGVLDPGGNMIIPCAYSEIKTFNHCNNSYFEVIDANGKHGIIALTGKTIVPCEWKDIESLTKEESYDLFMVQGEDNLWYIIKNLESFVTEKHKKLQVKWKNIRLLYNRVSSCFAAVQEKEGHWGYIDVHGNLAIPCLWDNCGDFSQGLARVMNAEKKWGYISQKGELIIPCQWQEVQDFHNDLAAVMTTENKWGFIDKKGNIVLPCEWMTTKGFLQSELALVQDSRRKWGAIDYRGTQVIPCEWDSIEYYPRNFNGWLIGRRLNKRALFDSLGHQITPCQWDEIVLPLDIIIQELIAVLADGKWGLIDSAGRMVVPCQWWEARPGEYKNEQGSIREYYASVRDASGKWWFVDKTGKIIP